MNATVADLWLALVPLAQQAPDPEDVKPGWLGFGVFLLLAAAVVLLAFSFRKQIKKVNFPEGDGSRGPGGGQAAPDGPEGPGGPGGSEDSDNSDNSGGGPDSPPGGQPPRP
jgi:hypothetical protein